VCVPICFQMDEEAAGLVGNVELDVMARLVDDSKDLVFIQKDQPDLLSQVLI
jgi:hypothetical protein